MKRKNRNTEVVDGDFDKIWDEIGKSTIPDELKTLYMMAMACELMNQQIMRRIEGIYRRHGYRVKDNALLKGLNDYCRYARLAAFQFEQRVEPQILGATYFAGMDEDDSSKVEDVGKAAFRHDQFLNDAGVLCRLVLLFVDRCSKDEDAFLKVFGGLRDMPSHDVFADADYERYRTKV